MGIQNIVMKVIPRVRKGYYLVAKKRKLKNKNPTIIASDCFGTFMYSNLGLRFHSPTINLFLSTEDFIVFCRHLPGFLNEEVYEVTDKKVDYPVGQITFAGNTIRLHFMHYQSFEEARAKWNKRKKRVDYSNIYIVLVARGIGEEDIAAFDALPYRNKMLITDQRITDSPNIVTHTVLSQEEYKPGTILFYKTDYSIKRYMDDIDYVSFLNKTL